MRIAFASSLLAITLVSMSAHGHAQAVELGGNRPACVAASWSGGFRGAHLRVANACDSPVRCSFWSVAPGADSGPFHTAVLPSGADDEQSFIGTSLATLAVDCELTDI